MTTASALAVPAGSVVMVAVQRRLGHSSIRVTSDIRTSVLEEAEREAAAATVAVVPRERKRVLPQTEPREENADDVGPEENAQPESEDGTGKASGVPVEEARLTACSQCVPIRPRKGPP
ncbi:hypothetical protein [Streptomyces vastus]|uniref:Integrase n=1 Tax=Streptomyces vastus TaxID=285451 RepID=A0ABN3QFW7_9ACTN